MTSCSSSPLSSEGDAEVERRRDRERVRERFLLVEENGEHPNTVLNGLNRLRLNKELCDVVLCCGVQEFPCHRAVLASFSSYFQAMFTCGMLESRQDRVNIRGVEAHILDLLLTFAYTSKVAIPKEHVQDVLAAANMLDVKAVQKSCSSYMQYSLDNSNCLGINSFAEAQSLETVERASMYHIIQHFGDVCRQEEFLSLPVDKVTEILSDEYLNVPKEEAVFEAAMMWINTCPTRRQHFEKFLQLIRLPLISPSYLHDAVESLEVVKESSCCQRLISEAMEQHHLPYSETLHPRRTKEVMVMVGGQSGGELLDRVECLDHRSLHSFYTNAPIYKDLARLPFEVHKNGLAVSGTALYVAGGELPDGSVSNKLWRYDPSHDDSWINMASMNEARCDFGLVMLDGYLWAVGGQDCSECFVERYDPRTNTWQDRQDMPRCSTHPVVVALDGLIYVFGTALYVAGEELPDGSTSNKLWRYDPSHDDSWINMASMNEARCDFVSRPTYRLSAHGSQVTHVPRATCVPAYKYNPKTSEWTEVAPMQVPRSASAACTLNGKIYVIGGEHSSVITNQVECYDPTTNHWTTCASMWHSCCHSGVVAMAGKIYILGGMDDDGAELHEIQEYCDQADKWEVVCKLPDYNAKQYRFPAQRRGPEPKGRSFFSCVSLWLKN